MGERLPGSGAIERSSRAQARMPQDGVTAGYELRVIFLACFSDPARLRLSEAALNSLQAGAPIRFKGGNCAPQPGWWIPRVDSLRAVLPGLAMDLARAVVFERLSRSISSATLYAPSIPQ